jgi:AbrB family looped-hinge helix DNA binding protein
MKSEYSTLTSKGQLVIPAELRRRLGMRKGTRVAITEENGRLILQPITDCFIDSLRGCLKGSGAFEYREREHKRDRKL